MADTAQRTGAAALIAALVEQDVTYVFGIPGVHTLLPYDLLHEHPTIRPIVTRHEAAAGFAADGYARASGHPGVCLVVPGPGATNLGTAALVAKSDSVPLVLITAALPRPLLGLSWPVSSSGVIFWHSCLGVPGSGAGLTNRPGQAF